MEFTSLFAAVVNCYVGCNVGAPDGQTLHVLACDTETGAASIVQTVTGRQGTTYFTFDQSERNLYSYIGETIDGRKQDHAFPPRRVPRRLSPVLPEPGPHTARERRAFPGFPPRFPAPRIHP